MKKLVKKFILLFYYVLPYNLPNYSFPGGRFYNWLRVFTLQFIIPVGKNCRIMRHVYIGDGNNVRIGNHCRINEGIRLNNIQIGDYVLIARNNTFVGFQHNYDRTDIPMALQGNKTSEPTKIEDDVWIGLNVIIMPGLRIRKGCIIGAGAVVTKDTEEYGIYVGNPARIIKNRIVPNEPS